MIQCSTYKVGGYTNLEIQGRDLIGQLNSRPDPSYPCQLAENRSPLARFTAWLQIPSNLSVGQPLSTPSSLTTYFISNNF
jgi:hypothetical protein